MGLLLGMTAARLQGLARHWQVETTVEPRTLVSQLYNQMTDEQAVKFLYESLSSRERLVLDRIQEYSRGWVSIRELGRALPFSSTDLQMVLVGLEEAGLASGGLARVCGNELVEGPNFALRSRPSVQMDIVRMTPEISAVLLRIKNQMAAGDQSDKTLHKLLGELTLPQLLQLASKWRIPHSDQCFKRELMVLLEDAISRQKCVDETLSRLGEEAVIVFRVVCEAGGRISVESLREGARLSERALKVALTNLVSHFLLVDTYLDQRRYLFAPNGVALDDEAADMKEGNACAELGSEHEVTEPQKVCPANFTFFFDLQALTNLIETCEVEVAGSDLKLPHWAVNQLKEELAVVAGSGFGPIRLECLVRVAAKLGLIETRGDRIVCTDKLEQWVALGVADQARMLFELWIEDESWCNEHRGYQVGLDPAKYKCLRKRLLAVLRRCKPGSWYRVDTIAQAVIGRCSAIDDTARVQAAAAGCGDADYREHMKRGAALSLGTLLYWTGGLSLGYDEGMEPSAISVNALGAWLCGRRAAPNPGTSLSQLVVLPNLEVMLHGPDPAGWRWLLKFAVTVSVGRVSVHQITKRRVQQAIARGCSPEGFLRFLSERCNDGVPQGVATSILEWAEAVRNMGLAPRSESLISRTSGR